MPSFDVDIEFEVFCGTCNEGLCNESDTRRSRSRGMLQITVNACPSCIALKNEKIKELEQRIDELESQIN